MNLYAESSAVLSWLFGETRGAAVRNQLRRAEIVMASDLTLVECERVIIRARALDEITEKKAQNCRSRLIEATDHWYIQSWVQMLSNAPAYHFLASLFERSTPCI